MAGETPVRSIRVSDEDWAELKRRAEEAGDEDRAVYMLRKALAPPTRADSLRGVIARVADLAGQIADVCRKALE